MNPSPEQIHSRDTTNVGIGSTIWIFNSNQRRYRDGQSGPIYRESFVPLTVEGETRTSWLCGPGWRPWKIDKRTRAVRGARYGIGPFAFCSAQEVDDACWVNEERLRIVNEVQRLTDAETLRAIDAVLTSRRSL